LKARLAVGGGFYPHSTRMSVKFSDNLNDPGSIAFESMRNGCAAAAKAAIPPLKVADIGARTVLGRKPIIHHAGKIAALSLPNDHAPWTRKPARPES